MGISPLMSLVSVKGVERVGGGTNTPGTSSMSPEMKPPAVINKSIEVTTESQLLAISILFSINISEARELFHGRRCWAMVRDRNKIKTAETRASERRRRKRKERERRVLRLLKKKQEKQAKVQPKEEPEITILTNIPPIPQGPPLPWESESEQEQESCNEEEWSISDDQQILPMGDRE